MTLPQRLSWLGKAQLVRVTGMESVFEGMCHAVAVRIQEELFKQGDFNSCKKKFYAFLARDAYLKRIFREYTSLEAYAAGTKIVLIYAMYCYIEMRYTTRITEPFYGNCIRKLYENVDYYTQWGAMAVKNCGTKSVFKHLSYERNTGRKSSLDLCAGKEDRGNK